jgi:hypothetical protein
VANNLFIYFIITIIVRSPHQNFVTYRDHLLQGFEISSLVFFGNTIDGMHNNKVFSRCISNLILVINETVAEALQLDENLSLIIPIYGLLFQICMRSWLLLSPAYCNQIA